jgi:hypothetical protein
MNKVSLLLFLFHNAHMRYEHTYTINIWIYFLNLFFYHDVTREYFQNYICKD